jgi:radical SAM family uncharacterized protein
MEFMDEQLEKILPNVRKPARYVGNELNSIHKDWNKIPLKVALAYPDLYEIGMSNLGIQILYHIINQQEDALAERVFCPAPDMEEQLTINNLQLTSLESQQSLKEFDLLGVSLGHELTYTNLVTILKLGQIPIYSKDRGENDPLIMAGGPCVFNPEPVADFVDFFVIGEAEEVILEIISVLRSVVSSPRSEILKKLAKLPGIYVPDHRPRTADHKISKLYIKDLDSIPSPTKPIIPFVEAVHDRSVVEIMRGCKWGCKFCQAGWVTRPVREKPMDKVLEISEQLINNTGYEELSLISLSSSDYSKIEELAKRLAEKYAPKRINIALPSMRTNSFSVDLAKAVSRVRPSSITIAPEAGTQRLRDVIGKNMTEADIMTGVEAAFNNGIESIKLYFMIGLPTETDEDLTGIVDLARKILKLGKSRSRRARVTINLATFIPKPHTPFQWEEQISIEESLRKQKLIRQNFKHVRWHQAEASFLEGVFSRGDRKLSRVIVKAWELGCRLDAWSEYFKFDLWLKALAECSIDPNEYLKTKAQEEPLPWDFIDTGVSKETLASVSFPRKRESR